MNHDYEKGSFLIANPVLPDPNFSRTVVLLCNHDDQGSFGLVVNKTAELGAAEIFENINALSSYNRQIYLGGPVSRSQVFYLCRSQKPIAPLDKVCEGIYLGISWDALEEVMEMVEQPDKDIRFYLGYSGWGAGQLVGEMERKSWLTCDANDTFTFGDDADKIWENVVRSLGKDYEYLVKAPVNPQCN